MILVDKHKAKEELNIKSDKMLRKLRTQKLIKFKKVGSHYKYVYSSLVEFANSEDKDKQFNVNLKQKLKPSKSPVKLNSYWT